KEVRSVNMSKEELLEYASAAETNSTHPIAKAIVSAKKATPAESMQEAAGLGVLASVKGKEVIIGKMPLLQEHNIQRLPESEEGVGVYVAIAGVYAGFIEVEDELKPTAKPTVEELHSMGFKTVLLSGDKAENAAKAASEIGLSEHYGDLLPEQKLAFISDRSNSKEGMFVFVGDGINDAPSLALADVGVAMGGLGSDAAVASADCVIMNDDPHKVVTLIKVAKKTRNRAIFNIACSLAVKATVMILSVIASAMGTWSLPLFVSVLADSGLAMLMILSSLHLGLTKPSK
ncbi:MAG: HAD-IC family P-type ATPase, partial [Bacilli bacterium]|nr:HAD-IC family P-type ATPase [Bacilli bacterium]